MKHLAVIQKEFLKEARKWNDLSLEEQRAYLKRHPASKRKITNSINVTKIRKYGFDFNYKGRSFTFLNKVQVTDSPVIAVIDKKTNNFLINYDENILKSKKKTIKKIQELADSIFDNINSSKKMKKMKFHKGQKVRLIPFEEEPEQFGKIEDIATKSKGPKEYSIYTIILDKKYCQDKSDDGLREVSEDQLEVA